MAKSAKNLLIYHIHDKELKRLASQYFNNQLIDIGCGTKPYQELLSPYVKQHIGVDHTETVHENYNIDLYGTAYDIPVSDASFDCALCSAVLEHLEEPELALRECFRVLKTGGIALYSVPFIWHLHEEPRDFYRFSKYGLQHLFSKVGFEIIEINALSGFWVTFGQLLVYNIYRFKRGPLKILPLIEVLGLGIQAISYVLNKIDKSEGWTWMYMAIVRKL